MREDCRSSGTGDIVEVLSQLEWRVCMSVGRLQQRAHCPCPPQPHLQVEAAGDSAEPSRTEKAQDVPVVRPPGAHGAGGASHLPGVPLLLQDPGVAQGSLVRGGVQGGAGVPEGAASPG